MQITAAREGKRGWGREEVWRVNKLQKLFTCGRGGGGGCPLPIPRSYVNCRVIKIIIIMLNVIKFLI